MLMKSLEIHSCYMKTQHIKIEILKEGLSSFYCNLIQKKIVLNMLSTDQICKENVHPFDDVIDDVTKSLDVCQR